MESPDLVLSIDEGPKKGETFDRQLGSFIRIGRVVRGNTLAIKDPAISQKHLIIEFHPDLSRWAVTDFSTSNGTTVNGAFILPNAAFHLTNGDIIKIGKNTSMSVKISVPSLVPEPRMRRGRRVTTSAHSSIEKDAEEDNVAKPEKLGRKGGFQSITCPESAYAVEVVKCMPEEGKRRRLTRASAKSFSGRDRMVHEEVVVINESLEKPTKNYRERRAQRKKGITSAGTSRNNKASESVVEGDCISGNRDIGCSTVASKGWIDEEEVVHEKAERATKGRGKEKGGLKSATARVLRKDASEPFGPIFKEQNIVSVVNSLPMAGSDKALIMKDEEMETLKKIEGLVNDGMRGKLRGEKGGTTSKVSWKDDVLEPLVVEGKRRRMTRASTITMSSSALVSKVHEGEDKKIKEDNVEDPGNSRGKKRKKSKRGNHSTRTSRRGKTLESVAIEEMAEGRLSKAFEVALASSARVPKDLQKKKMMVALNLNSVHLKRQKENKSLVKNNSRSDENRLIESSRTLLKIEESNNTYDSHIPNKTKLAYSWSSFSEIRGIPNTTSKYREDKMINCHATPFEARVERALNKGIAEASSIMET